jgi:hypothetical protein
MALLLLIDKRRGNGRLNVKAHRAESEETKFATQLKLIGDKNYKHKCTM